MELPVQPSSQPPRGRNFERAPWCYLLWSVPAFLAIGASAAYGASVLSLTARGVLWVTAVRVGGNRLSHKRAILRQGPLQNRWDPISNPQYCRRVECAFSRFVRLEPVLACFHRDSGWELRPRVDLEEVLVMSDMARADEVRNYPD